MKILIKKTLQVDSYKNQLVTFAKKTKIPFSVRKTYLGSWLPL